MNNLVVDSIRASNLKEEQYLRYRRRILARLIKRCLGRKYAKRIEWDGEVACIDGIRFYCLTDNSIYDYANIYSLWLTLPGIASRHVKTLADVGQAILDYQARERE